MSTPKVKLSELDARWFTLPGLVDGVVFQLGVSFLCPQCRKQRIAVPFQNPIDPQGWLEKGMSWRPPAIGWKRVGETFDTLTLDPSIDVSGAGHFHGHVCDGFISILNGSCVVKK